jgi:hypothetical protein
MTSTRRLAPTPHFATARRRPPTWALRTAAHELATATQPGDLGTAAAADVGDFATAAQGAKADSAVQPAHALAYTVDVDVDEAVAMIGQTPVPITTYAGSPHSIVHPSLLFFPEKWNGWRYWMAYTPYNNGDYQWENPCIAVSNDGESWSVPVGLINPIDPYPGVGIGYNADPCLCMTADGSTMLMVWKRNSFTKQTVMATSTDGVTWSPRQVLFENAFEDASPALLWDGTGYRMWTVKHDDTPNTLYLRTAAAPEGPWSAPVACTVSLPPGPGLWHMDIKRIGQQYHMVMASVDEGTGFNNHLWFGKSNDGLTWTFGKQPLMDTMSVPQDGYYKAGLVPKMTPDGISYEMWYSAIQGFTLMRTTVTFDRSKRRRDINNGILAAVAGLSPWVFADNFNRADTTAGIGTATTGQAWSSVLGNVMGIASGRAYVPVAGNSRSIVEIGVSDFRAGITFHTLGSSGYLMFRYVDATNLWRVGHGNGVLVFQKIVSGVLTTIPTAGRVRAGDRVEVECRGSLIRLFLNGLQVFEATDAALSTGTKLGLNIDNTTTRVDDVTARTL